MEKLRSRNLMHGCIIEAHWVMANGKHVSPVQVPSILFFVAVQPSGAVPQAWTSASVSWRLNRASRDAQVRELCAVTASPALSILDVDKEQRYRWESDKENAPGVSDAHSTGS